jgi:Mg2+ and Co2+ transporter CorA
MPKPDSPPGQSNKLEISIPQLDRAVELLQSIDQKLTRNTQTQGEMMAAIEDLQTEVSQNTDLTSSVVRLVDGLADQLEEALANNDTAAVQAVVDQMRSNNQSLADAVAANTQVNPL